MNISPVAGIPHQSRNFIAILDLSLKLIINGFEMPSLNEATKYTAKQEAIDQLGKVLPRIIAAIAESS